MDKTEVAKLMLDAMRLLTTFAKMVDPAADHVTCFSINGNADVTAYAGGEKILDAHYFGDDGTIRVDDEYIRKEQTA